MLFRSLFIKYPSIELNDLLIQNIKNKKAKIIFFYITEGYFGEELTNYEWVENLCIKYNFDKEDITLITANLNAEQSYKGNKFKLISYNYFADELNFALINKRDENNLQLFINKYTNFIDNFNLEKHFLCFNNLTKLHRLWMFYELINNSNLKNKSIVS